MILSVVVILIVGLIAYMHYVQGLLSGLISCVLALIASAMAMSYYEPLATMLSGGKFNDTAQGICLLSIFALVYLICRIVFDKFVPGNVRVPYLADKIGGAVLGLFAGLIAMGMVVIALQTMPFGPSIAGYARYAMMADTEKHVAIASDRGGMDRVIIDQTKNDNLEKDSQGLLLMPVDDLVVGLTKRLSDGGALSTGHPFASVHPDLLQELFGQRLGIETGTKHTASNAKETQVSVEQINVLPQSLPIAPSEFKEVWEDAPKGTLKAQNGHRLISVTVMFGKDAADDGGIVRLSPGSVRMVVQKSDDEWQNYFPVGTVQGGKAWCNRIDDFIFIDVTTENRGANFIFDVDESALVVKSAGKPAADGKPAIPPVYAMAGPKNEGDPGTFIEVKRLVKLPLEDVKVEVGLPPDDIKHHPMRKTRFFDEKTQTASAEPTPQTPTPTPPRRDPGSRNPAPTTPTPTPTPTPPTPTPPAGENGWADAPLEKPVLTVGNQLPVGIGVGSADVADVLAAAASGHLTNKQFDTLDVDTTTAESALSELPKAGNPVQQLAVPAGKRLLQVTMSVKGADPWAWAANLANFTVVDAAGTAYKPSGVVAVATVGGAQRLYATYKTTGDVTAKKVDGATLSSVTLLFLVPADQKATELRYQGKPGGLPLEK